MHHLCDLAAAETLPRFRSGMGIDNKQSDGFDPVTEADKEAENVIRQAIRSTHPEHGILGEEHGSLNPHAEYRWIIDPIDGTRGFIAGLPLWGTLIALYHNGKPLAGIMDQPFIGERYFSNGKTSVLQFRGTSKTLQTTNTADIKSAIMLTTSPVIFTDAEMAAYQAIEQACRLARYGTDCYAYCMLASGQVDLVVESGLMIYDIAALIPIVENAGGMITGWKGETPANGGRILAAANPDLHRRALEFLLPVT